MDNSNGMHTTFAPLSANRPKTIKQALPRTKRAKPHQPHELAIDERKTKIEVKMRRLPDHTSNAQTLSRIIPRRRVQVGPFARVPA